MTVRHSMYQRSVEPPPYLWHMTRRGNRESIYRKGILLNEKGWLYANASDVSLSHFYPIVWDWSYKYSLLGPYLDYHWLLYSDPDLEEYDYWRINTREVENLWFPDPDMQGIVYNVYNYLRSRQTVPPSEIELHVFDASYHQKVNVRRPEPGVAAVNYSSLPLRPLNRFEILKSFINEQR